MLSESIDDYQVLWTKPHLYVLIPASHELEISGLFGDVKLIPYRNGILRKILMMIPEEFGSEIVQNMIDADVEILEKPYDSKNMNLERIWTDQVHEFVLYPSLRDKPKYDIYHPIFNEAIRLYIEESFLQLDISYDDVIQKMIEAGVEIWDKSPYK